MYKLDKKLKDKWTSALRSGEYKQGRGVLYNSEQNTYCCLGVLGSICGYTNLSMDSIGMPHDLLPLDQIEYPEIDEDTMEVLIQMNDGKVTNVTMDKRDAKDFKEIADYIEENL